MTQEEKAKRYDEAIKVAKSNYETIMQMDNDCTFAKEGIVNTFHHMFPELKEKEDKMIRKELIKETKGSEVRLFETVTNKELVAWLEKQGNKDEEILVLKDQIESLHAAIKALKEAHKIELEKQGGQKPTDKVESNKKFTPIESALKDLICDVDNSYTIEQVRRFLFEYGYKDKIINAAQEEMLKPAWSEDDEKIANTIINEFEQCSEWCCANGLTKEDCIAWLKSLRPQNRWKPSDEQMSALSDINCTGCISYAGQGQELINLYIDLKKLKG